MTTETMKFPIIAAHDLAEATAAELAAVRRIIDQNLKGEFTIEKFGGDNPHAIALQLTYLPGNEYVVLAFPHRAEVHWTTEQTLRACARLAGRHALRGGQPAANEIVYAGEYMNTEHGTWLDCDGFSLLNDAA